MADPEPSVRNDEAAWSKFDADEYCQRNYGSLLPEDAEIIEYASKFLIEACGEPKRFQRALDVGAGTNLYPSLLMLPWTEHIDLTEYAPDNIRWLNENLTDAPGSWQWQPFWDLVAHLPCYQDIDDPRRRLADMHQAQQVSVQKLSIFELPTRTWDLGSMFFVADGITTDQAEFKDAVLRFLGALKPGSPFLMAFMEGSHGYDVHGVPFPSVRVTPGSLDQLIAELPVTGANVVLRTDNSVQRLRNGYDAMLLVTGFIAA